jgi:hypothetical protein
MRITLQLQFQASSNPDPLFQTKSNIPNMAQNLVEDDFEVIESPEVTESRTHVQCSDPLCQRSHSTFIEEEASDRAIAPLLAIMQATSKEVQIKGPIFHLKSEKKTDSSDRDAVFNTFTESLPLQHRRVMNCQACKSFMRQYGDLCVVGDEGSVIPLSWPLELEAVPAYYKPAVANVLKIFKGKEVGDEFKLPKEKGGILGIPGTGGWRHMSIELENVPVSRTYVDSQDTSTSFTMLDRILQDNTPEIIAKVSHLILTDQLPYATSHKAPLEWLQKTAEKLAAQQLDTVQRKNLVTRYSREAFVGCLSSLRGGLLGYLFECVREGQSFETLKQNWETKAGPTVYLRPTAAPSAGNIQTAERIFANMGYTEEDLKRVFLTLDEVPQSAILWPPAATNPTEGPSEETPPPPPYTTTPTPSPAPKPQGIFTSLLPPAIPDSIPLPTTPPYTTAPLQEISFRHFALRILPTAQTIHILPSAPKVYAYFFTRGLPNSKPLFAFHNPNSHTASWYTWDAAAPLSTAHLSQTYTPVKAILTFPHMWDYITPLDPLTPEKVEEFKFNRLGIRYLFVLEGARDMSPTTELCLFPQLLRSEFHGVRGTIEAFSKKGRIAQPDGEGRDHVGGFEVAREGKMEDMVVGVESKGGQVGRYKITLFE